MDRSRTAPLSEENLIEAECEVLRGLPWLSVCEQLQSVEGVGVKRRVWVWDIGQSTVSDEAHQRKQLHGKFRVLTSAFT